MCLIIEQHTKKNKMKILKREFRELPGVGNEKWEIGTIAISVTAEHLEDIKATGVDGFAMIEDVIANEVYQFLSRIISKTARDKKPQEIKWQKDSAYWLSDLLSKCKPKFIITNIKIGAALQYINQFEVEPIDSKTILSHNGSLYLAGKFDGVSVYIDPVMLYTEDELAIIENDFIEYHVDQDTVKTVVEGTKPPRITLDFKYKIHNANSSLYQINNVEI